MLVLRIGSQILQPFAKRHQAELVSLEQTRALENEAKNALLTFFNLLATQHYKEAATYYGGSYDEIADIHPQDADNPTALLEDACTVDAYLCYPVQTISSVNSISPNSFEFEVQFAISEDQIESEVYGDVAIGQRFLILVAFYDGRFKIETLPSSSSKIMNPSELLLVSDSLLISSINKLDEIP